MKKHTWEDVDNERLRQAVEDCTPIFEHYTQEQNKKYSDANAWDAVAGRLLPEICVTGAACRRQWEKIQKPKEDAWKKAADMVADYERDLAETTFDGVTEILGGQDAIFDLLKKISSKVDYLWGQLK